MRKFTLLIASLFITVGAMAQVTVNTSAYTVKSVDRGYLYYDSNNAGSVTSSSHTTLTNATPTGATNEQFAFLRTENTAANQYYMYSIGASQFVTYTGSNGVKLELTDEPACTWVLEASGTYYGIKVPRTDQTYINITNFEAINGCKVFGTGLDEGNKMTLAEVATGLDLSEAIAKIEVYESNLPVIISDFQDVTTTFGTYEGTISNIVNGNIGDKWWSDGKQAVDKNITVVLNNVHQVETIKWYFCNDDKPHGATIERKATADGEWINVADFTIDDIENNVFTCTADGNDVKELRLRITTEDNSWLKVAEVELYEFVDAVHEVIYNYVENDVIVGTMTYNVAEGSAYPDVVSGLYGVTVTGSKPDGNVTAPGTHEIAVEIGEMPFEYASTYAEIGNKWCNLVMHSNEGNGSSRYRTYVGAGDATTLAWGTHRSLTNAGDDYYWAFVGNPINGFRVVNKAKGENFILSSNGSANPVMLEEATLADGYNTTWQIADRTSNGGNDWVEAGDWFCLKYRANWYMNANAGAEQAHINFWNSDDNGSGILAVKPLTIDADADVATYFAETSFVIPGTLGAEVYYVDGTNENGNANLVPITGTVYQETGVVVKFDTEADVTYAPEFVSPGTTTAVTGNLLKGTTKRTLISKDTDKSYYVLGMVDGVVGLYNAKNGENKNEFYNGAFKAYLELPAAQGTAAFYGFDWDGTTGIDQITDNREQSTAIYDLTGRRVEAITAPGIYVVNGKKVLVK
ncbi:MAG: hypothetical protein IKJ61_00440 [Bacteroidaceae bacterium]|nr:hypothetical protein [Bacteroidaceae bacterium]